MKNSICFGTPSKSRYRLSGCRAPVRRQFFLYSSLQGAVRTNMGHTRATALSTITDPDVSLLTMIVVPTHVATVSSLVRLVVNRHHILI